MRGSGGCAQFFPSGGAEGPRSAKIKTYNVRDLGGRSTSSRKSRGASGDCSRKKSRRTEWSRRNEKSRRAEW